MIAAHLLISAVLRIALVAAMFAATTASAQQSVTPALPEVGRYYEKPFDVAAFMPAWEAAGRPAPDIVLGFLAGVFTKEPRQISRMAGLTLQKPAQIIVVQALRFAQKIDDAKGFAQLWGWPADEVARVAPVPPLLVTRPEQPGHFDTFWGATFATGDVSYIRPIFEYYASTAAEPGIDVNDIAAAVFAQARRDKDTIDAIVKKYPRERLSWVMFAGSALFSLESNGRQHPFVAAEVERLIRQQPNSAAARGFAALRAAAPPR